LSQERVIRTLASFGLTRTDAKVYIYLAKGGSQKGKDLCNSLKMQKQQLYPCLRSLRNKGVVTATCKRPVLFSAMPFEEVLDLFTKANIEEVERMIQNKKELLFTWRSIIKKDSTDSC
jgi:sugar-specific transcriptional regulator TrmB